MKRYEFRLDQVLRVRRAQADEAANHLGIAQRSESAALLAEMARRKSTAERTRLHGSRSSHELLLSRVLWDAELDSLSRLEVSTNEARVETDHQRSVWLAASRRVRALEMLDDRRREEHRVETDRAEGRRIDDLVASRHKLTRPPGAPR